MTDKEIVIKAINKVGNKGLNLNKYMSVETFLNGIIFDHKLAKAFWGEEKETYYQEWRDSTGYVEGDDGYQSTWQHHLQQMVLEKEPLKYLEKFLPVEVS